METEELIIISIVIIVLLLLLLILSQYNNRAHFLTGDPTLPTLNSNPFDTQVNLTPSAFMEARYKVLADDGVGDNTEPLNDLVIRGLGNNIFETGKQHELPQVSMVNWHSEKSTPEIAHDDKRLEHIAAELQTPEHRVLMSKKTREFLPYTGGQSRLNFSSYENSHNEPEFRQ